MRVLAAVVVAVIALGGVARAEDAPQLIALLPLDAEKKLEIYGQPVANEVAKVLRGAGLTVTVVGARMGVPDETRLIIDGTIAAEKTDRKGDAIVLTLRIRNPADGATLGTLSSTAASVATMDQVVPDISARLLPAVRAQLTARPPALPVENPPPPLAAASPPAAPRRALLTAIKAGAPATEVLRTALATSLTEMVVHAQREPTPIDPAMLARPRAARAVKEQGTDLGIVLELEMYTAATCRGIPCARAQVRVRVADAVGILFDRIVVTDTIIGDRGMTDPALAARTAREVFAILRPKLVRTVPAWR